MPILLLNVEKNTVKNTKVQISTIADKNIAKIDNKTQILELNLLKEIKENTLKLELNLPPKFYFYPNAVNASKFIYSNNYQAISKNGNGWYMINCSKPLPKNKISIYFKIEKTTSNYIMIEICPFSIRKLIIIYTIQLELIYIMDIV